MQIPVCRLRASICGLVICLGASPLGATTAPQNVFEGFTWHIEQQVQLDKRSFVDASTCTEWFYKKERIKGQQPEAQGIALRDRLQPWTFRVEDYRSDCHSLYPRGLDEARQDFSRTQTTLSLSLTFYEFALVGDKDDDGQYSPEELQDIVESFGLGFEARLPAATQLSLLNAKFDSVHQGGQFDVLMTGLTVLYDKGYRFTNPDKVALNRVSG